MVYTSGKKQGCEKLFIKEDEYEVYFKIFMDVEGDDDDDDDDGSSVAPAA